MATTLEVATSDIDKKFRELHGRIGPLGEATSGVDPIPGTRVPGNFEAIVRMTPATASGASGDLLAFYFFSSVALRWQGPIPLVADGKPVTGVTGNPVLAQSAMGGKGNFELIVPQGGRLAHYYRDNDSPDLLWHAAPDVPLPAPVFDPGGVGATLEGSPVGVSMVAAATGGVQRDFKMIVRMSSPALSRRAGDSLLLFVFDVSARGWKGPFPVLADGGSPITGVTADPVLIEHMDGVNRSFDLLVPRGHAIAHYSKTGDDPATAWEANAALPLRGGATLAPVEISAIQGNFGGNLEAVVRWRPTGTGDSDDVLTFCFFDRARGRWEGPFDIVADGEPVGGVSGSPALIQGTRGRQGNFELLVPRASRVDHYIRDNDSPGLPWHFGRALPFPQPVFDLEHFEVTVEGRPVAVTVIQSNFGEALSFTRSYERGRIDWASDTLAQPYVQYETQILYRGLHCFGKQRGSGSDEPYVVISVFSPGNDPAVSTVMLGPYVRVEDRSQQVDIRQLWQKPTTDVVIHTVVMEHDFGPTEEVRDKIQQALKKAANAMASAAAAAEGTPPVDPESSPTAWYVDVATGGISFAITEIFGLGDDVIGQDSILIRATELVEDPRLPLTKFRGIEFNYPRDDSTRPPISDSDASYKVYFEVKTRTVELW